MSPVYRAGSSETQALGGLDCGGSTRQGRLIFRCPGPCDQKDPFVAVDDPGVPGTGKSTFLAELIRAIQAAECLRFTAAQRDTPETLQPACLVRNLAGMLAELWRVTGTCCPLRR